ncbi:unnamed protein product [Brassica oleracea var. botrytis]
MVDIRREDGDDDDQKWLGSMLGLSKFRNYPFVH